ncbi:hypothetical protein PSBY109024_01105 [Pseudoalteromonas byunsanensis]
MCNITAICANHADKHIDYLSEHDGYALLLNRQEDVLCK